MATIDIVMPLYNKAATVAGSIRSIQRQTFTDWRLIVVDDGSTDDGAARVAALNEDRLELVRQDNQGPGAARNAGLARANADYVAFLDADDEWYPWYLANALAALEDEQVSMVTTMFYQWPKRRDMTSFYAAHGIKFGRYRLAGDEDPEWVFVLIPLLSAWNSVVRREVAVKYEGFYGRDHCYFGEDATFFMRIAFGETFAIIGPPAVRYRHDASGIFNRQTVLPLEPFLADPSVVLDFCPATKQALMLRLLDRWALRTVRHWARYGRKAEAAELLARYPGARSYRRPYWRCRYELALSRWFPYWISLKWRVGPPVRAYLRAAKQRLGLGQAAPALPDEAEEAPHGRL